MEDCVPIRSRKCGALPTSVCATQKIHSIQPTGGFRSLCNTSTTTSMKRILPRTKPSRERRQWAQRRKLKTTTKKVWKKKNRLATKASPENCYCDAKNSVIVLLVGTIWIFPGVT